MTPPSLPQPFDAYNRGYMQTLIASLNVFFAQLVAVRPWSVSALNINLATLPTEADLATLRSGDVYRDTAADNALKVKV